MENCAGAPREREKESEREKEKEGERGGERKGERGRERWREMKRERGNPMVFPIAVESGEPCLDAEVSAEAIPINKEG